MKVQQLKDPVNGLIFDKEKTDVVPVSFKDVRAVGKADIVQLFGVSSEDLKSSGFESDGVVDA